MLKAIIFVCFLNSQVCLQFNYANEWYSDLQVCQISLNWYLKGFHRKHKGWLKQYSGPYILTHGCYVVPINT